MKYKQTYKMTLAAVLVAVGIIIPMFSPIKFMFEPMSFTLGSHVAIMIAMFISPSIATSVAVGTTLGFFLSGMPLAVVLRAATHVVWALVGAYYLFKHPQICKSFVKFMLFIGIVSIVHGLLEVLIVYPLYVGTLSGAEMFRVLILLVGVGTFVHSCVDYIIACCVWKVVVHNKSVASVSAVKQLG